MKKRFLPIGMAAVMLGSAVPVLPAPVTAVYAAQYEQLSYEMIGRSYIEITGCDDGAAKIVIPAEIDGIPVTGISAFAFREKANLNSRKV